MIGTEWDVVRVVKVTDGDTVRLIRSRQVSIDTADFIATDADPKGVPVRLVWVDTPERGDHPGWENARDDLLEWIFDHGGNFYGDDDERPLRVVIYDSSAGFDRLLGDLIDADGNSASQWLMTKANGGAGWPPYTGAKA